jgi:hypothetical protein
VVQLSDCADKLRGVIEMFLSMTFPLHINYFRQVRGLFGARFVNSLWFALAAL